MISKRFVAIPAAWLLVASLARAADAPDPEGFTPDMGSELVAFLARVVERTAERWPRP